MLCEQSIEGMREWLAHGAGGHWFCTPAEVQDILAMVVEIQTLEERVAELFCQLASARAAARMTIIPGEEIVTGVSAAHHELLESGAWQSPEDMAVCERMLVVQAEAAFAFA